MVKAQMEWVEVSLETEWVVAPVEVDHMLTVQERMENQTEAYLMVDFLVVEQDTITVVVPQVGVVGELSEFSGEKTELSLLQT